MTGKMKVSIMTGIQNLDWDTQQIPKPSSEEVLVKLKYVGICGSDLHYYETGAIGDIVVKPPFILGHEASGVVVEVGKEVKNLKIGDRVALEPGIPCGHCEFCRKGLYNLCPDVIFFATPPVDGVFKDYCVHKEHFSFKLPDNVDLIEGALIEPLAVGFHAVNQANAHIGQNVVIFGAGCIGLMTLLTLKAVGLSEIYVVDIIAKRLNKALELGAKGTINANEENVKNIINNLTNNNGFDLAIETAGSENTTNQCIESSKSGGTIVLVGYGHTKKRNININVAIDKELTFKTVFRYRHIYPMAIEAVANGKIHPKEIVSNVYNFDDISKAFEESIRNKDDIIKSVIKM